MSAVAQFKGRPPEKKPDEIARLKVLKGSDLGSTFILKKNKITIGRGEGVDVYIQDMKSSRVHATLELIQNKTWVVKDLGSANGIILNGKMVRQGDLKSGDYFQIGETLFEFFTKQASLKELVSPIKPELHKESIQKKIKENIKKTNTKNYSFVLFGAFGLFIVFILLSDNSNKIKNTQTKLVDRGLPQFSGQQQVFTRNTKQKHHIAADRIFNQGFREYVEKNYLRSYYFFDQALNTDPTHKKAEIYKKRSSDAIFSEVKKRLSSASLSKELGRKQEAISHYEAIKRLLHYQKNHPDYILAEKELKELLED